VKRLLQTGLRLALGALLLLWVFHSIFVNEARTSHSPSEWAPLSRAEQWRRGWSEGPPALWQTLTSVQPGWFALSVVLMGGTLFLGVVRWRMVLRVQGLELPAGRATEISLVAHFFNSLMLGSTGGDLMKAYYAARETHHKKTEAVTTVFVDRLIGLWSMLLFAGAMMIPNAGLFLRGNRETQVAALLILGMLAACSILLVLAFRGGVSRHWAGARGWLRRLPKGEHLERSLEACRLFGREPWFLTRTLGVSMLLNLVCVIQWQVVGWGLGLAIPTTAMLAVVPTVICIAALPLTPSGLGVRETLFVYLLDNPAIATKGLSLALLAYLGFLIWSVLGGVVYMLFRERHQLSQAELDGREA
jgi:uncharacterized protein (TIRG00374 family)